MRRMLVVLLYACAAFAQREPVLKQIDLPHPYYFREMYLPQLTSGPSWVAWAPDSKEVVYSMAGSLWRQKIDSSEAVQLTNGPGYDYQPDWSHDGRWIVYTKYDKDALELWLLEVANGKTTQLTQDGAVNVEPRFSPDGKHILYVSTRNTKHFHLWLMELVKKDPEHSEGPLLSGQIPGNANSSPLIVANRQLTKEFKSALPRYYYSHFDHEINPSWSPDGKEILFVSNHGHIHGTGGIWRAKVPEAPDSMIDVCVQAKEIHYEETTWKARPEFSPDGKRIVYASYAGRQWHQLWLMTADGGGNVFPLTYGDHDNINPRWSPDGARVASIDNSAGKLQISILERNERKALGTTVFHAISKRGLVDFRPYLKGTGFLNVRVATNAGFIDCGSATWVQADDSFFPGLDSELHYTDLFSNADGSPACSVPVGKHSFWATRGMEFASQKLTLDVNPVEHSPIPATLSLAARPLTFGDKQTWRSGDLHVHMNYAGTYRARPETLMHQLDAEDLNIAFNLLVNKEQRFPDEEYANLLGTSIAAGKNRSLTFGQEFHTSYWGHLGLLNINHLILPGYAAYPNTAAASLVPMNADVADMAHSQNKDALVGYVHPFDELPDPYKDAKLTNELPVDVALGKVDYYEVLGFSDHKSSAAIWYRLLNLGFRIPAGAGTDAMTNFASLRGPVGLNRVYVNVASGPLNLPEWLANLKAGKTFATNGPLLRFNIEGKTMGEELALANPGTVHFTAAMRSIVPVDKAEVVCNGEIVTSIKATRILGVVDSQRHDALTTFDANGAFELKHSGWCVLRAYSDHAEEPIMDIYPYATTSPIYVIIGGEMPRSPDDAKFFVKWIDRIEESASQWKEYNTDAEKQHVLDTLHKSRAVYEKMAQ